MIEHISLRDFQSWHKLDLDLGPVTMLVGRGNSGKTAIIRALKYALTNQTGDDFIREGAPGASVGLAFNDNTALMWLKARGKSGEYRLESEHYMRASFTKTGAAVPPEVAQATGIHEVVIDKTTTLMPNIQMQFDTPFIIGESGSKIARILGRLTKLNILVTAQMACRTDAERSRHAMQEAIEQHQTAWAALDAFPDTSKLKLEVEALSQLDAECTKRAQDIERARRLLLERRHYVAILETCGPAGTLLVKARKLHEEVQKLYSAKALLPRRNVECARLADAGVQMDAAQEQLVALGNEYEEHCQSAGMCGSCPWR